MTTLLFSRRCKIGKETKSKPILTTRVWKEKEEKIITWAITHIKNDLYAFLFEGHCPFFTPLKKEFK